MFSVLFVAIVVVVDGKKCVLASLPVRWPLAAERRLIIGFNFFAVPN